MNNFLVFHLLKKTLSLFLFKPIIIPQYQYKVQKWAQYFLKVPQYRYRYLLEKSAVGTVTIFEDYRSSIGTGINLHTKFGVPMAFGLEVR